MSPKRFVKLLSKPPLQYQRLSKKELRLNPLNLDYVEYIASQQGLSVEIVAQNKAGIIVKIHRRKL